MKKKIISLATFIWHHLFGTIVVLAILWLTIFSDHSMWAIYKLNSQQADMQREIVSFRDSVAHFEQYIKEVSGDTVQMEHFARERMRMKKANEDVFLVE